MSRRNLWLIFAVTVVSLLCYSRATRSPYGRWLAQAMETIEDQYIEPVDSEKLFDAAMSGMVGRLDNYSAFLPRRMKTFFNQSLEQKYGGIGVEVALRGEPQQMIVMSARVGGPAYEAGVHAGDRIVEIDGKDTESTSFEDALQLLRGKPGTDVTVRVRREGEEQPLEFHLTRALIQVDSVLGDVPQKDGSWNFMLPGEDRIGYIRIETFGDLTVDEFTAAMRWLAKRDCRGVIIDLRNNPGGLLDAAEEVAELFLPAGAVVVTTRGRDARVRKEMRASGDGPYQDLPVVVLVNKLSASASEILAAALQDHDRATIVGERSFGKGTVQNLIPIEAGNSSLKLTIATYWRPSEKNIHRMSDSTEDDDWGVRPNEGCEVKLDKQQTTSWEENRRRRDGRAGSDGDSPARNSPGAGMEPLLQFDPQLRRAVEVMQERLAARAS